MVGCLLVADSSGEGEKECQHLEGFHQGTASHSITFDHKDHHGDYYNDKGGVVVTESLKILALLRLHPLLQATYTGVRITVLGNIFFPSFLAKTKLEQPLPGHIHCEIWPRSLRFRL